MAALFSIEHETKAQWSTRDPGTTFETETSASECVNIKQKDVGLRDALDRLMRPWRPEERANMTAAEFN